MLVLFFHLRHYTANLLPTKVFGISRQTIANIISTTLIYFDNSLSHLISMGTEEKRIRKEIYFFDQLITFLMNGSKQKTHASKHIMLENNLFSSKKDQHSITILIILSPYRCILFVSVCFMGALLIMNSLFVHSIYGNPNSQKERETWVMGVLGGLEKRESTYSHL